MKNTIGIKKFYNPLINKLRESVNMLKKISSLLSPDLVKTLMEMGHGDEIVIADGNFPAASHAKRLVRSDGLKIPELLEAVLELFPLDIYVESPVSLMKSAEEKSYIPEIWDKYKNILVNTNNEVIDIDFMERFDFYERSKSSFAIITTSEKSLYANILLKKGVIE